MIFLIALATLPVYVSGNAAAEALAGAPSVAAAVIAAHNDAALTEMLSHRDARTQPSNKRFARARHRQVATTGEYRLARVGAEHPLA